MQTDPKLTAKTWQREWLQGLNAIGFVFVIIVIPTAIILTAGLSRPIVLWGSFIASIIAAPFFLIWQERKQRGINMYKLDQKSKASNTINVEKPRLDNIQQARANFLSEFFIFEKFLHELSRLHKLDSQEFNFPSAVTLIRTLKIYDESMLNEIRRIITLRHQVVHGHGAPDALYIEEARLTINHIMTELLENSREDVRTAAHRAMELNH